MESSIGHWTVFLQNAFFAPSARVGNMDDAGPWKAYLVALQ